MIKQITLSGDVPSKKNSQQIYLGKNGKRFITASKNYKHWHEEHSWRLGGHKKINSICSILLTYYPSTRRRSDLTNKSESVMDLLVDNEIIDDDNWFVVPEVRMKFGGVDKVNPRVEIKIYSE